MHCVGWQSPMPQELGMAIHNDLTGAGGVDAGEKLDARAAIAGKRTSDGQHLSGLFDRGSWIEAQAGWAQECGDRPRPPWGHSHRWGS